VYPNIKSVEPAPNGYNPDVPGHSKGNKAAPGKWLQHIQTMDTNRIPKQALQYKSKGRRNIGRPRKRWSDLLHFEDQGTGNTPKPL
jgi:hypothetical protein